MARKIPEQRFDELVFAAVEVFIARGYRQTQMSDIASAVGVAKGTLYGYVESKDALFILCAAHADRRVPLALPAQLPVAAPPAGSLAALVKQRLNDESIPPALSTALSSESSDNPRAELEAVVGEFYDALERNCRAIKLMDRCADHPELREIWQAQGREGPRLALERYLASRIEAGQLRPVVDTALAARLVIEVATTWAVHIKWDRSPQAFAPDVARTNAIDCLVHSFVI